MKRKRIRTSGEFKHLLTNTEEIIETPRLKEDASITDGLDINGIERLPDTVAPQLGRPEGFHLSEDDQYRLNQIVEVLNAGVLNDLSEMQRACFTAIYISGETFEKVAKRYGVCRGAVQTHVRRAAAHIRKAIEGFDD